MSLFRVVVQEKPKGHWQPLVDKDGAAVAPTTSRRLALNLAELAHRHHYKVKVEKIADGGQK